MSYSRHNRSAKAAPRDPPRQASTAASSRRLKAAFFRRALDSSTDSVRVLDWEGRLQFVNRAGLAALEIEDFSNYAGRHWTSVWPEPGRNEVERGLDLARRGKVHRFEGECPTARGTARWWDVAIAPVFDADGDICGLIASSRDITAARRDRIAAETQALDAARAAAGLRSAVRIAQVGSWEVDFVTQRTFFSPELCELLGSPPLPQMPIREALQFWCEDDRDPFMECLDRVATRGEALSFEGRSVAPDGSLRWWRLLGEPVMSGVQCVALRGAAQNVTRWREAAERERAAVHAAEAMSGFLATMGHELRTPLNGVLGMAQAMGRGKLATEQCERLGVLRESGETLLSLLDDLLDLSKIEACDVELEIGVVDLQSLADGARATFSGIADKKGVNLRVTVTPPGRGRRVGDPKRVRQVLHNLISNAIKFTDQGSIDVEVLDGDETLVLRVSDTGAGIPAGMVERVFDKFVQADASASRRHGGSGLGLTVCRDLVNLMNGDIEVESVEGEGSAFTVRLPLPRASEPGQPAEPASPPPAEFESPSQGLRVLVAEDNRTNQMVFSLLLSEIGIQPVIVANGQEALNAWRAGPWDIVLMDIQMPVMDGVTAVKLMRQFEHGEGRGRTPIIAVTANVMPHQQAEYLAAGMDAMIAKPIDFKALIQAMDAALELIEAG